MSRKRIFYYKFVVKLDRKLKEFEISAIKNAISNYLDDYPKSCILGGEANNNGYYKFKTEKDKIGNKI